jgi:hypothetical protein
VHNTGYNAISFGFNPLLIYGEPRDEESSLKNVSSDNPNRSVYTKRLQRWQLLEEQNIFNRYAPAHTW